jgi:hypothetical protein
MPNPKLVNFRKIWDFPPHSAMTDLIRYQNAWFCTFRESDKHVHGKDGAIRILTSNDKITWHSCSYFQERGEDFRDPKLSITPDGELMLLIGCTTYREKEYISMQSRVCFSLTGHTFSPWEKVLEPHEWLWRVTWHRQRAWGVSYRFWEREGTVATLWVSDDGINYDKVVEFQVPGSPSEGTIRFLSDDTMICLLRRDKKRDNAVWIGTAKPPYKNFQWKEARFHLGGPNFLILPNDTLWASGRIVHKSPYGSQEKVAICRMSMDGIHSIHLLPSGGEDTSYPGMVWHEGHLFLSYYSSHEGKASIYFAEIALPS